MFVAVHMCRDFFSEKLGADFERTCIVNRRIGTKIRTELFELLEILFICINGTIRPRIMYHEHLKRKYANVLKARFSKHSFASEYV